MVDQVNANEAQLVPNADEDRFCVACGYNLRGLGDEPRCPECGLLNIPAEFRRQVWELVDSGKWFFSGFFHPFRKRLPGWWWALDREGDVKRSLRALARNASIAIAIIMLGGAVIGAFPVEHTVEFLCLTPDGATTTTGSYKYAITLGKYSHITEGEIDWNACPAAGGKGGNRQSQRVIFRPSWEFLSPTVAFAIWALLVWAFPAMVGLYTQIRKGLPDFARAPRTIVAAANYESHRLIYIAVCSLVCLTSSQAFSWLLPVGAPLAGIAGLNAVMGTTALLVVGGWVGPVRSDYTKQLIRSRRHATRIVIMYALILPPPCAITVREVCFLAYYALTGTVP